MPRPMIPADSTKKIDWYQEVTNTLVAEMEKAQAEGSSWKKSWQGLWKYGLPTRNNGVPFTGINVWLLALAGNQKSYSDPRWYTFDQAKEKVGYERNPKWRGKCDTYQGIPKWFWKGEGEDPRLGVRGGEKGTHVIRVNPIPILVDSNGNRVFPPRANAPQPVKDSWNARMASGEIRQKGCFVKIFSYCVFNAQQIDGMPVVATRDLAPGEAYDNAECLLQVLGVNMEQVKGCDTAAYSHMQDKIIMPCREQFETDENYWATLLHELVHWTGHGKRLDRGLNLSGTEGYAFEELVAEIGSAFLCAHLGIEGDLRHPEYLASWIKVLKSDNKAVIRAATLAQKAVDFIINGGKVKAEEDAGDNEEEEAA